MRSSETFNNEAKRVAELAINNWKQEYLGNRPPNSAYFISTSFFVDSESLGKKEKTIDKLLSKGKYEKASVLIEELIHKDPFNYLWYEKRAEMYGGLEMFDEATSVYETVEGLKREVLASILLIHKSMPRKVIFIPATSVNSPL